MAKFPVDPSSVTAAWLSEVLGADVRECRLEQIGIGVGLLGRLYRAHLEGGPDVPTSVVVKLPLLDSRVRSEICEDLEFYLARCVLPGDRPRQPAAAGASVLCRLRRGRPTTSSSCSRILAASASPTRSWGAPLRTPRPHRRHRPPPRLLVGERPLRGAAMAEDVSTPPFPAVHGQQFRGRLATLHRGCRRRPIPGIACLRRAVPLLGAVVLRRAHAAATDLPARRLTSRSAVLRCRSGRSTGDGARLADHREGPGGL